MSSEQVGGIGRGPGYDSSHKVEPGAGYDTATLRGKSVIITGGARGLGEAFAQSFVQVGAFVTIGDINDENGKKVVQALGGEKHACFVHCDTLEWTDQLNMFKTAIERSPSKGIDIVCANAGVAWADDVYQDKVDEKTGDPQEPDLSIFKINTEGIMLTAKLALHYLPRQPEGEGRDRCLILTASIAGYIDLPRSPQYNSSKWAVRGMMRCLRHTVGADGMRVNVLAPWYIHTAIMSQDVINFLEGSGVTFAKAEDAAKAMMHIACDTSLNGRALAVVTDDIDPRGYFDIGKDDYDEDDVVAKLQKLSMGIGNTRG